MNVRKFSEYLLYTFLFLLPFQTVFLLREPFFDGMKWEYGVIGVYAIDILLVVMLGIFFFQRLKNYPLKNHELRITSYEKVILSFFLFWSGLSVLWAGDQILGLYFFVKLLLGVGLFLTVRGMEIDIKKVVFIFLAAGVIQGCIGIGQFLYQHSPESSFLGISSHEAFRAGSSVLKIDSGRFLRAYGTFPHPNILGGFLGVILVMSVAYYVFRITYRRSWVTFFEILLLLGGSLLVFLGLILTFSRVAWFGVLLGIFVVGLYAFKQKDSWVRGRFLKILFALLLAGFVFGLILYEQIVPRFDTATIEREGSVSERVVSLQDARSLIADHPLIGVGAGNFTAAILEREKGDERGEMEIGRPVWNIQPAHNVFLLVWSELGIVGLMLLIGFLVSALLPILILKSKIINHQSAILIALLPSLFLDHWLWTSHFGLLFFFFFLGFVSQKKLTE